MNIEVFFQLMNSEAIVISNPKCQKSSATLIIAGKS